MALDIGHEWAGDLTVGPTGDLSAVGGSAAVTQRILRRLLTNPGDYIWNPIYGAGLPGFVGTPESNVHIGAIVRRQMALEASVAASPTPDVSVLRTDGTGAGSFEVTIRYADAPIGQLVSMTLPVTGRTMQLSLQTFQQLLQRMSASVQSSAGQLIDLSVGSLLRAILEANASIGLWIQWLIVQTLAMTRAATSSGTDLDSWMADFKLARLPATAASGVATFTRLLTAQPALIPAGTQVKTTAGTVAFVVGVDVSNATWQPASNGYLMPSGAGSISLPVVAQTPGSIGNVTAGAVSVIASPVPGVDSVTNPTAFGGGCDAESDAKFRARFGDYINSRSRATVGAVAYAIASLQQSLRYKIFENTSASNSWMPGHFVVVVDDGAGNLTSALSACVYAAVDQVRPVGSTFSIQAPAVVPVMIGISLGAGQSLLNSSSASLISVALTNYVECLPIGSTLALSRIIEVAYRSGHIVQNISSISINGSSADLVCAPNAVLQVQSVTVQ